MAAVMLAVITTASMSVSGAASAKMQYRSAAASECETVDTDTTYCTVETQGLGGVTGVARVLTYWHSGGSLDGSICVADTNGGNGAFVKVNLNAHRIGQPVDNDNSHYVDLGTWTDSGSSCVFQEYSGSDAGGIDFIYINYADSYDTCDYCYQGTYTVHSPL